MPPDPSSETTSCEPIDVHGPTMSAWSAADYIPMTWGRNFPNDIVLFGVTASIEPVAYNVRRVARGEAAPAEVTLNSLSS